MLNEDAVALIPAPSPVLAELAAFDHWVAWKAETRSGRDKPTKVPYSPTTGRRASSTDPATWGTFDRAAAFAEVEEMDGVGFVLGANCPIGGFDIDGCIAADGAVALWAQESLIYARHMPRSHRAGAG